MNEFFYEKDATFDGANHTCEAPTEDNTSNFENSDDSTNKILQWRVESQERQIRYLENLLETMVKQNREEWRAAEQKKQATTQFAEKPQAFLMGIGFAMVSVPAISILIIVVWSVIKSTISFADLRTEYLYVGAACVILGLILLFTAAPLAKHWVDSIYEIDEDSGVY